MSNLGSRLRENRILKKLTAKELSEKSGVPEKTIYRIETGEVQDPKISSIAPIAKQLNCSLDELILGKEHQTLRNKYIDYLYKIEQLDENFQECILDAVQLMVLGCDIQLALRGAQGVSFGKIKIEGFDE